MKHIPLPVVSSHFVYMGDLVSYHRGLRVSDKSFPSLALGPGSGLSGLGSCECGKLIVPEIEL